MCLSARAVLVGEFKLELRQDQNQERRLELGFMLLPKDGVGAKVEVLDGW